MQAPAVHQLVFQSLPFQQSRDKYSSLFVKTRHILHVVYNVHTDSWFAALVAQPRRLTFVSCLLSWVYYCWQVRHEEPTPAQKKKPSKDYCLRFLIWGFSKSSLIDCQLRNKQGGSWLYSTMETRPLKATYLLTVPFKCLKCISKCQKQISQTKGEQWRHEGIIFDQVR